MTSRLQETPAIAALRARLEARVPAPRWSSMFWPVTVASFAVVLVTGLFLMFFFDPSIESVRYDGSYLPLRGTEMSRALESTLAISFDVRGGLLVRQLHNWSASLMIAALLVHILQTFFTGGFRGRRAVWVLLFALLFAAMGAGLTGLVLPDDLASGSSLAVLGGILRAVPVAGSWLSFLVFGGAGTSGAIPNLYPVHVVLLPLAMAAVVAVVLGLAARRRPETPTGPGRGMSVATALTRRAGVVIATVGLLVLVAATVTVNPVWLYGPADPGNAAAGVGAVWYLAFLDGAQRLVPSGWEVVAFDRTWTLAILVPVGVCGLYFAAAVLYPYLEGWIRGRSEAGRADRARDVPTRTAIGVAGVVFFGVLWAAAGSDLIATQFRLGVEDVVLGLQIALLLGPPAAFAVTIRVCIGLRARDRDVLAHGYETGRIVRMPGGRYVEVHAPLDPARRQAMTTHPSTVPMLRPGPDGRIRATARVRSLLARWFVSPERTGDAGTGSPILRGSAGADPEK
jgi:ubiquinol-cytochrome c reductase cytochrome b subunit